MFMIAFAPIIDIVYTINLMYLNINFPIQQILRIFILLYFFINLKDVKNIITVICIFALLMVGQVYIKIMGYPFHIMSNFSFITKLVSLFVVIFLIKEWIEKNVINVRQIIYTVSISMFILTFNIILSNLFKIGLKTYNYGNRSGYKGLIEAHNDVVVVMLIVFPLIIYANEIYKKKIFIILGILMMFSLWLIGPKAGKALLIFEIFVYVLMRFMCKVKHKFYSKKYKMILTFIAVLISVFLYASLTELTYKMKSFANSKGYHSFYSYVVSSRDIQTKLIDNEIANEYKVHPKYQFGMGYYYANSALKNQKDDCNSIENDLNGLIYYTGIFITSVVIMLLLSMIIDIAKKGYKSSILKYVMLAIVVGFVHSFFGGHVLYSALANTYLGIVIGVGLGLDKKTIRSIEEVHYE